MKEKILAQLVAKYPGVPKKFLGLWADKLAAKVTEESGIEGAVNELENLPVSIPDLATEFQREGDRRVSEATKPKPAPQPEPAPAPTPQPPDDTPAWARTLLDKVSALENKDRSQTMQQRLQGHDKLKSVPQSFYRGRPLPSKDDEFDSYVDTIAADFADFQMETNAQALTGGQPPLAGAPTASATAVDAAINAWAGPSKQSDQKS